MCTCRAHAVCNYFWHMCVAPCVLPRASRAPMTSATTLHNRSKKKIPHTHTLICAIIVAQLRISCSFYCVLLCLLYRERRRRRRWRYADGNARTGNGAENWSTTTHDATHDDGRRRDARRGAGTGTTSDVRRERFDDVDAGGTTDGRRLGSICELGDLCGQTARSDGSERERTSNRRRRRR